MSCYSVVYIGPELSSELTSELEVNSELRDELLDFCLDSNVIELFHFTEYSEGNTIVCGLGKVLSESNGFNTELVFSSPDALNKIKLEVLSVLKSFSLFQELQIDDIKVLHTMYQNA